ncbi:MAG: ExbD/TolR family protein [Flavobacteriales bacterium]
MKHKFKKDTGDNTPKVSTAALPDIVFMLLFFFMTAATPKKDNAESLITVKIPNATELSDIKNPLIVGNVYIGIPKQSIKGSKDPVLCLNDKIYTRSQAKEAVKTFVAKTRNNIGYKDAGRMEVDLRVDESVDLGFVNEIKDILSEQKVRTVYYKAVQGSIDRNIR